VRTEHRQQGRGRLFLHKQKSTLQFVMMPCSLVAGYVAQGVVAVDDDPATDAEL
jgi:hypothetical protein